MVTVVVLVVDEEEEVEVLLLMMMLLFEDDVLMLWGGGIQTKIVRGKKRFVMAGLRKNRKIVRSWILFSWILFIDDHLILLADTSPPL